MAKRKGSPRMRAADADQVLRRGRRDEQPPREKPPAVVKIVRAAIRESEILPGVPLS